MSTNYSAACFQPSNNGMLPLGRYKGSYKIEIFYGISLTFSSSSCFSQRFSSGFYLINSKGVSYGSISYIFFLLQVKLLFFACVFFSIWHTFLLHTWDEACHNGFGGLKVNSLPFIFHVYASTNGAASRSWKEKHFSTESKQSAILKQIS